MKAELAALVFTRARWREGEPTDQLDKVATVARERAARADETTYISKSVELAVAEAAEKMRDSLARQT